MNSNPESFKRNFRYDSSAVDQVFPSFFELSKRLRIPTLELLRSIIRSHSSHSDRLGFQLSILQSHRHDEF